MRPANDVHVLIPLCFGGQEREAMHGPSEGWYDGDGTTADRQRQQRRGNVRGICQCDYEGGGLIFVFRRPATRAPGLA
jgi:hypothetical protein